MGYDYFRVHPKGVGLVCRREGGLAPLTFVQEYLGEMFTPWRWFEIQVTVARYTFPPVVVFTAAKRTGGCRCVPESFPSLHDHLNACRDLPMEGFPGPACVSMDAAYVDR